MREAGPVGRRRGNAQKLRVSETCPDLDRPAARIADRVPAFMTAHIVNVVLSGVFHASILFLVSAGLQVVFGVQKIFNLACGSFYALGAYFGVSAVSWYIGAGGPPAFFIVPLVLAGVLIGVTGVVVERGLLQFVYDRDETFQLLLTFAVVLMMEDLIRLTWGTAPV